MADQKNGLTRREFNAMALAGAGVVGMGALGFPGLTAAQGKVLKMAFFTGPMHPIPRKLMIPMAKALNDAKVGLNFQTFAGGQIGGAPPGAFRRVVNGISDVEWHLPGYTSSVFPKTLVMEIPLQHANAVDATKAIWKIYDKHLAEEYNRVKLLALWATDTPVVMTNKKVRHPDDLKGLKIRTPSANQAAIIEGLGAVPVAMPMPATYGALEKGVVDGAIVGISVVNSFKLGEVVNNYIIDLPFGYSPQLIAMNLKTYQGLNSKQRGLVDGMTGLGMSLKGAESYEDERKGGIATVNKRSNTSVTTLTAAEKEAWVGKLKTVVEGWVDQFEKQHPGYRSMLKDYLA